MNLVKAQELAKDLSIQELQKYANGFNPAMMPPYIALGALQAKEAMQKKMAAMQGGTQGEQPSIKEQIEQRAGLMALQDQQQKQAQAQMAQQAQSMPMPAPEGIPQPEGQPEPQQAEPPMGMAQGGIARLPVQFNFDEGGIIGYAEGNQVKDPLVEAEERVQQALAKLRTYGLRQRQIDPEGYAAAEQENQQAQKQVIAVEKAISGGPVGAMGQSMGEAQPPAPTNNVQPMAERLSPSDMALRSAPAGLAAAAPPPPVKQTPALLQAPRPQAPKPTGLPAALPSAAPTAAPLNMAPNQDQLIAEEAARRKTFGVTEEAGAAAEGRMAGRRAQYEAAKPSGLDDLIRVFGQAGQYKGLSGLGPAYTANEDRKRAQQAAFEAQMEEQQTGLEAARRAEGLGRAGTIGTELGKSRELASREKIARENNLTQLEASRIAAASANRPGETERMMAEYGRLKAKDPSAAEQFMLNIGRIKSGASGERQDLAELKNLQAIYKDRLDLIKGATVSKDEKADAAKKLNEINNKIAAMAGIGGATQTTPPRIKFDAAGNQIK